MLSTKLISLPTQSFFNRKIATGFAAWSLLWAILHTTTLNRYVGNIAVSATDALVSMVFISAACLLVINNFRYYLPGGERFLFVAAISVVLGFVSVGLSTAFLHLIFWEDNSYHLVVSQSWLLRFAFAFLLIACAGIVGLLWYVMQEQKEAELRRVSAERMMKDAELFKLRQQLQPHFLFNSLNSISALTISNAGEARHMIQQLSDFLRSTLQRNEQQMITLQEELRQFSLYLDIEKVRFGHRLQTEINCSEEAMPMLLPALLLQPAVENAIKFGLYDTVDDVTIEIKALKQNNNLLVTISNPFDPDTAQPVQGTGFGLQSTRRRLYLLFARQDLLQTSQQENIFTTTILIPSALQKGQT